jgi:hypothetical protein
VGDGSGLFQDAAAKIARYNQLCLHYNLVADAVYGEWRRPRRMARTRLWAATDELCANSKLQACEGSLPALGLILVRHADSKFSVAEQQIRAERAARQGRRQRPASKADHQARGQSMVISSQ